MELIYIVCKDKSEAKKISKALLEKKLIACANMHPIESMFEWEGKIQEDNEVVLIVKTNNKFKLVEEEVKKIHSYDVPCIIKLGCECNQEYKDWVDEVIN